MTFIVPLTNLCRSNALVFSTSSSVKLASYLWKITRQACSEYTLFILRLTFKRGAPYSGRPVWCHCGFRAKTSRFSAGQQVCQQNPHYFQTHCCHHSNCSGWSTEIFEDPPFPALRETRLLHFRDIKFLLINLWPYKIRWWYVNTPLMQRKEYSNVVV